MVEISKFIHNTCGINMVNGLTIVAMGTYIIIYTILHNDIMYIQIVIKFLSNIIVRRTLYMNSRYIII